MNTKIIIRFDDIYPTMNWDIFLYIKKRLEILNIKSLLGVIPHNKDIDLDYFYRKEDFFDTIYSYKTYGDTIAQHGTYHKYTSNSSGILKINNRSEFAGHDYNYQYKLLKIGKKILKDVNCWEPVFMAPSHSFDHVTLKALVDLGFTSITDGYGLYPFKRNGINFIPQLSSTPFNIGFGIATICLHLNHLSKKEIDDFITFINKNRCRIISYEEYKNIKKPSTSIVNALEFLCENSIKFARKTKKVLNK